jgi:hypothetical protein
VLLIAHWPGAGAEFWIPVITGLISIAPWLPTAVSFDVDRDCRASLDFGLYAFLRRYGALAGQRTRSEVRPQARLMIRDYYALPVVREIRP